MRKLSQVARLVCLVAIVVGGLVATAAAQTIGPVSWQLQPYCNVITISATTVGSTFRLEGFDDQCGAVTRASVVGSAFVNPNGTIGLGFNIVATPGGAPVHIDATLTLPALNGIWRDSVGGAGAFTFGPGGLGGPPRPVGATGTSVLNVVAGPGLVGGGSASAVNVGVNFAGPGAAATVAHSDHTHGVGTRNTVIGDGALASNVSGADNTALGWHALAASTAANGNTAIGADALASLSAGGGGSNIAIGASALNETTSACCNVAIGNQAMQNNTIGIRNIAIGQFALFDNSLGFGNVAVGRSALSNLSGAANQNVALGDEAGINVNGGSESIFIGNTGAAADTLTIKIGTNQTRTFIAGVNGGVLDGMTDIPVNVDAFGKLGTTVSSARFKTDIADVQAEGGLLHRLRPVSFRYLPAEGRGNARQVGLIAEEVAEVMPELVVNDADGKPYTVRYQLLPPLLLAEIQRLERERRAQDDHIAQQAHQLVTQAAALEAQAARLDAQARELSALRALIDAVYARR